MLRKLDKPNKEMFNLIGTAIMRFMEEKRLPFPGALLSKKHFQRVHAWRRGQIYIRLLRSVLDIHANSHWYNFGYPSYKFSINVFNAYCAVDAEIWNACTLYESLPVDFIKSTDRDSTPLKKRSRSSFELATPESENKSKLICLVSDDSSSASESEN